MSARCTNTTNKWTHFNDMHSGGGQKLDWGHIFIEAPQKEAEVIFQNRFGRNPNRVTCTCCGPDYSISEAESLQQATAYVRGCAYVYRRPDGTECEGREGWTAGIGKTPGYTSGYEERGGGRFNWNKYVPLDDWLLKGEAHIVRASDIKPDERQGTLKPEGYVWAGDA